jgi:hypothetical protein
LLFALSKTMVRSALLTGPLFGPLFAHRAENEPADKVVAGP